MKPCFRLENSMNRLQVAGLWSAGCEHQQPVLHLPVDQLEHARDPGVPASPKLCFGKLQAARGRLEGAANADCPVLLLPSEGL